MRWLLTYPLKCIFEGALQKGKYPDCWKRANVVSKQVFIKKESKSLIKSYRHISLLPILGKIFERLICKDLFNHFYCNNLFTKNQSEIRFMMFWDFSVFYQIFLSPQGERWAIITYKDGIYELPNDLRLRILGN